MDPQIIDRIKLALQGELPGEAAHGRMMSYNRPIAKEARQFDVPPRESAVMCLLFPENNELCTLFMLRPDNQGVHSGQLSFPGGKKEASDLTHLHTALRETEEEMGFDSSTIQILGALSELYIPPSNFLVQPYIGYLASLPELNPNADEVKDIISFPLEKLFSPETIGHKEITLAHNQLKLKVPVFMVNDYALWGATAMMVAELKMILEENNITLR
jgi:8-oxo-dGTP pyrophosphatase MutT (NUDIX family)